MPETVTQEEAIFHAVLELDRAEQQSAFLDQACVNQPELRRRVEALLRRADAKGPLDRSILNSASGDPVALTTKEGPGTVLGPYKLLEQIGEGGMGVVYLAEQQEPVRREVALKVIKPGMDSRQVVARFEAERQALAIMDHPNIARVLDAGTTETGRPYFVMELVRGIPITEYCDQAQMDVRQRLDVFIQVCRAVQHAHTKGIIHRDLKPGNVLVTSHDCVPVPKVIDFGVAKALEQPLTERTLHTGFAQLIGTPLYMSPEQAEFNLLGVDTRSDIYSLGVMLYELLTGSTPFCPERLRTADFDEMRRMLREEEPPRPSKRLSTLGAALSTVSQRRGADPRKLSQMMHGELDWIVLKALEKDRTRRYETASALAADVQRYLKDEPVEACPPSRWYRLRKIARRQRRSLITAGVIVVALVAATAVSVWQAVLAREAQHQAEADQERAKSAGARAAIEAATAQAVNQFLQEDLLRMVSIQVQIDEGLTANQNLTVKEALDRASNNIGKRFQDQPLIEAAIRFAIGNAYRSLGEFELAGVHLEKALAIRRVHLGPAHRTTLDSVQALAANCTDVGRPNNALNLYADNLEFFNTTFGFYDATTCNFVSGYARAHHKAGNLKDAERLWRANLEMWKKNDGEMARVGPRFSLDWLSRNLIVQKRYKEAEAAAREALAIYESGAKPLWGRYLVMSLLGGALLGQKNYEDAEQLVLEGYKGLKDAEFIIGIGNWRINEAMQRIVDFYEATNELEQARSWREKLGKDKLPR